MELLYAGMPQLLLPIDMEKLLCAQAMANHGFANQYRLDHAKPIELLISKFQQSLGDQAMRSILEDFSISKRGFDHQLNLKTLADGVHDLISG